MPVLVLRRLIGHRLTRQTLTNGFAEEWDKVMPLPGLFTISAKFEQVFEA